MEYHDPVSAVIGWETIMKQYGIETLHEYEQILLQL